jgi:hypothetical protein
MSGRRMVRLSPRGPAREKCPVHHQGGDELDFLDALQSSADNTENRAGGQIETDAYQNQRYAVFREI